MYQWQGDSPKPDFDEEFASTLTAKYILIGITYLNHDGSLNELVQMHGVVEAATPEGIKISLRGSREGETWTMPPVLDAITPANPGVYTLRGSSEVVEDPDFLSTWTVNKPALN